MAPPRKRKTTSRQRRKMAARERPFIDDDEQGEVAEPMPAKTSAQPPKQSGVDVASWTRKQIAALVAPIVVIQVIVNLAVEVAIKAPTNADFVIALLTFAPFVTMLGALMAMPVVRRQLRIRKMRILETLALGALISLISGLAYQFLGSAALSATNSPATTSPSASASPSGSARSAASPQSSPSTSSQPSPSPRVSPTTASSAATRTSPATGTSELISAVVLSDALGIGVTIWAFPTIYGFFWMPNKRARERDAQKKKKK